ncbi:hypothetical protein HBHAL_2433 [Halobacillus halophilus DSM 2266]|uniref:Uncharacterized protein n=1 Tax=Halobacillus halophilus (strain ATCC 35676 / DSM 2266 / JCM 20832 / KCTC 3685 / LMG 17431 / NBRC 102448 / NCIMB 2269) TaxID=866895 RepID=I0JKV7_HALH3|nr:hypothetical protein HBHAL_2433 [Halobacillus halophilus DSM 2266]
MIASILGFFGFDQMQDAAVLPIDVETTVLTVTFAYLVIFQV